MSFFYFGQSDKGLSNFVPLYRKKEKFTLP